MPLIAIVSLISWRALAIGSWTNVVQSPPGNNAVQLILQLSDGTVMAQQQGTSSNWYRLTPDIHGSYINGSWTNLASMNYNRQFYSSAVLRDGRVFVAGGEIVTGVVNPGGNKAEVYDPRNNLWTEILVPAGLICTNCSGPGFSDSGCVILPNGNVMIAPVQPTVRNGTVIFNPTLNSLSQGPAYLKNQDEATWVKLPDDSILTIDPTQNPNELNSSERYIPSLSAWTNDGTLTVPMYNSVQEIGPGLLLPDGRAVFIGGLGHIAYYNPTGNTSPGNWTAGPDLITGVGWDDPAAMMVNGKVLIQVGCATAPPYCYYELDPTSNYPIGTIISAGNWGASDTTGVSHSMLNLPDGTVLVSNGTSTLHIYRPDGVPVPSGKPTISSITLNADGSYLLTGTKLNGISQGSSFGDDAQMDSNYPLVRLTDGSGNKYYARTYNWSSTGVMTGNTPVTTEFTLPLPVYGNGGPFSLVVVANGISSDPVSFTLSPPNVWVDFNSIQPFEFGSFTFPDKTLAKGVTDVTSGGTIAIKPGSSTETLRINKPMTIMAIGGTAGIGHGH